VAADINTRIRLKATIFFMSKSLFIKLFGDKKEMGKKGLMGHKNINN
jgi:hypothetical protein